MNDEVNVTGIRSNVYGPYDQQVKLRERMMKLMTESYYRQHGQEMPDEYVQYLWDIFNKLSRLAVSPDHQDSWFDMSEYARFVSEILLRRDKNAD